MIRNGPREEEVDAEKPKKRSHEKENVIFRIIYIFVASS
tara:strand:- start:2212 stop:2328 length:117 start_codon:yes stop_codon:yes gene_type:complete